MGRFIFASLTNRLPLCVNFSHLSISKYSIIIGSCNWPLNTEGMAKKEIRSIMIGKSHLPFMMGTNYRRRYSRILRLEQVETNIIWRGRSPETIKSQMIHLDKVDVKRGNNIVLEQIVFCFTSGEWVLLCGPSGAGKSSLLRLIEV